MLGMDRNWAPWLIMICWTRTLAYADYMGAVRGMYITIAIWFIAGSHFLIWDLAAWLQLDKTFLDMRPDHRGWQWAIGFARYVGGFYLASAAHAWMNRRLAQRRLMRLKAKLCQRPRERDRRSLSQAIGLTTRFGAGRGC